MNQPLLKKQFSFGKLVLPNNVFYAPLAGCSDLPFRKMGALYRPGMLFCEMVKMEPLTRGDPKTLRLLDYEEWMHPIGAQICGSNPKLAATVAKMIEDKGFDVIDLNCGCPVDKVTKDGSGSGMLKNPELIGEIVHIMKQSVSIPVTIKIRAGWDDDTICADKVTQIAEAAGATSICVHGRTREQAYRGPAKWDYIKMAKNAAKKIIVIGNGDVIDQKSAIDMMEQTGCDGVLIGRATLGKPWLVSEIFGSPPKSGPEMRDELLKHLSFCIDYKNEKGALLDMKKLGCWYLRRLRGVKKLRHAIAHIPSIHDGFSLIEQFDWHEVQDGIEEGPSLDEATEC